jgi:hypothetical protein
MRRLIHSCAVVAAALLLASSAGAGSADTVFADGFESLPGFSVQTPDIVVPAGTSATYCYYFRAPNDTAIGVRRFASTMTTGVHHLILYASYDANWMPAERQPAGTLSQIACGANEGNYGAWLFAAHHPTEELVFPADDGSGNAVAAEVAANQPLFVQIHVANPTAGPLTTSALLTAQGLSADVDYTRTATYTTSDGTISIPANASGVSVQHTCTVPASARFWWLSTRTHHFAMSSKIVDGPTTLVVSTDWAHPQAATFGPPAFHAFTDGFTTECVYDNDTGNPVFAGESEDDREVCMGIGYFFPAPHPAVCLDGVGPL